MVLSDCTSLPPFHVICWYYSDSQILVPRPISALHWSTVSPRCECGLLLYMKQWSQISKFISCVNFLFLECIHYLTTLIHFHHFLSTVVWRRWEAHQSPFLVCKSASSCYHICGWGEFSFDQTYWSRCFIFRTASLSFRQVMRNLLTHAILIC